MAESVQNELTVPEDLDDSACRKGVERRLQDLLDKQDQSEALTPEERGEAESLADLMEIRFLNELDGLVAPIRGDAVLRSSRVTPARHPKRRNDVTSDEFLGVKPPKCDSRTMSPETRRLWKKFQQFETLPEKDQHAVIRLINSLASSNPQRMAG